MIISIDAEKTFDKIHHPLMIKTIGELVVEANFLNLIENVYKNPTSDIILIVRNLKLSY